MPKLELYHSSMIRVKNFKIDSVSVTVKIKVNPDPDYFANPTFDELNETLCVIDQEQMKYEPVKIRFYHLDGSTSLRKLLWHENELVSDVRL